jgi:hypothetical protein
MLRELADDDGALTPAAADAAFDFGIDTNLAGLQQQLHAADPMERAARVANGRCRVAMVSTRSRRGSGDPLIDATVASVGRVGRRTGD